MEREMEKSIEVGKADTKYQGKIPRLRAYVYDALLYWPTVRPTVCSL